MAITRYAGDRFTIADGETKPTGVLDGAYLIDMQYHGHLVKML